MSGGRKSDDLALLLPGAAAGLGGGLLAGVSPLAAAGIAATIIFCLLQWNVLFALLSFLSITQSSKTGSGAVSLNGIMIGRLTFRPAMAVVIPFVIRAFFFSPARFRNRLKLPEYMLAGYVVVLTISSFQNSPDIAKSLPVLGLLAFGVIAYCGVYASVATPERLRKATVIFLTVIFINALYGIVAVLGFLLLHTHFGITIQSDYGPGVFGLSYEHDIFASTCGAGAVMFFALWREPNRVIGTRYATIGTIVCTTAMLIGLARAAWLAYGVAMLGLIILTRRGARSRARFGRAGVVLLAGTFVLLLASYILLSTQATTSSAKDSTSVLGAIKAKAVELVNTQNGTGRGRVSEFRTAMSDVSGSPLIGLGANTYGLRHPRLNVKYNYIGNVWLRAVYEGGFLGLLLLLGAIVIILWPNRTLMSSTTPSAAIARALTFGAIVLVFAYLGTDDTLYMWPWMLFGLVHASRVVANREHRRFDHGLALAPATLPPAPERIAPNGGPPARRGTRRP
jgi:O-antigen ligase